MRDADGSSVRPANPQEDKRPIAPEQVMTCHARLRWKLFHRPRLPPPPWRHITPSGGGRWCQCMWIRTTSFSRIIPGHRAGGLRPRGGQAARRQAIRRRPHRNADCRPDRAGHLRADSACPDRESRRRDTRTGARQCDHHDIMCRRWAAPSRVPPRFTAEKAGGTATASGQRIGRARPVRCRHGRTPRR